MLKGLFINSSKAQCSIYESGRMIYEALALSDRFILDYVEIDEKNREISLAYDFFAFNYHPITMNWLNTRKIRRLPGLKLTFILEVLPNNPFVLCPSNDFDVYCALDPTMMVDDQRVYSFPRPLEPSSLSEPFTNPEIPIIGSFGFATSGKGFELVVDAVNKEFEKAVVRINIPSGTFTDEQKLNHQKKSYAEYLGECCSKIAKKGIDVKITHEYMTKTELINWCAQNTLNCFLYNRNQPGLSATTDQAITSGRPLAVSTNETFRHIHQYITPYPFQSLRQSIENSPPKVLQMQRDWAPVNFAHTFERLLEDQKVGRADTRENNKTIVLDKYGRFRILSNKGREKLSGLLKTSTEIPDKSTQFIPTDSKIQGKILLISHKEKQCGIHQYGENISEVLRKSKRFEFIYCECSSKRELADAIKKYDPQSLIYNYYPATLPWLNRQITRSYSLPQLGIMHEVTQEEADSATAEMFDFHLCPDPTLIERNPIVIKTKRLIPHYINTKSLPEIPTIGSFGFGFGDKGFERLIEIVQREFDVAKINILMPFNDIVDKKGKKFAVATAKRCHAMVHKPGINLRISHDFLSKQALLDFLASNTINAFFYDVAKCRGISSTIEHALAVQRPLAITKCGMFRHIVNASPSICIEESTLQQIIDNDIAPLVPFYNDWSEEAFIKDYERIIGKILS